MSYYRTPRFVVSATQRMKAPRNNRWTFSDMDLQNCFIILLRIIQVWYKIQARYCDRNDFMKLTDQAQVIVHKSSDGKLKNKKIITYSKEEKFQN